jgi:hypothetical protein
MGSELWFQRIQAHSYWAIYHEIGDSQIVSLNSDATSPSQERRVSGPYDPFRQEYLLNHKESLSYSVPVLRIIFKGQS